MSLCRYSTTPETGAAVGVPCRANMSTPLWSRPPERGAPHVSVKLTGPATGQIHPSACTKGPAANWSARASTRSA